MCHKYVSWFLVNPGFILTPPIIYHKCISGLILHPRQIIMHYSFAKCWKTIIVHRTKQGDKCKEIFTKSRRPSYDKQMSFCHSNISAYQTNEQTKKLWFHHHFRSIRFDLSYKNPNKCLKSQSSIIKSCSWEKRDVIFYSKVCRIAALPSR